MPKKTKRPVKRKRSRWNRILRPFIIIGLKANAYLSQRHVWLSLSIGLLWMLSAPFIITFFQASSSDSSWIPRAAYFPFELSALILTNIISAEAWIAIYLFSFVISMVFCLTVASIIHQARIRKIKK